MFTRIALLMISLSIVVILVAAAVYHKNGEVVERSIQQEDGPVEYMTVFFFLSAAVLAIYASRQGPMRRYRIMLLLLGTVCVLAALEEISFGERLLGYDTPESFEESSTQGETDFHNIPIISALFTFVILPLVVVILLILPVLQRRSERAQVLLEKLPIKLVLPGMLPVILFAAGVLCILFEEGPSLLGMGTIYKTNEYQEFLISMSLAVFGFELLAHVPEPNNDHDPEAENGSQAEQ